MSNWTLFSNHGHVLFCLTRDPEARLRDVAGDVGITERAVQKIVRDLQDGGMVSVIKNGRRNNYRIHTKTALRHELEADCTLKDLIKTVNKNSKSGKSGSGASKTGKPVTKKPELKKQKNRRPETKQAVPGQPVEKVLKSEDDQRPVVPQKAKDAPARKKPIPAKRQPDDKEQAGQEDPIERQQGWLF